MQFMRNVSHVSKCKITKANNVNTLPELIQSDEWMFIVMAQSCFVWLTIIHHSMGDRNARCFAANEWGQSAPIDAWQSCAIPAIVPLPILSIADNEPAVDEQLDLRYEELVPLLHGLVDLCQFHLPTHWKKRQPSRFFNVEQSFFTECDSISFEFCDFCFWIHTCTRTEKSVDIGGRNERLSRAVWKQYSLSVTQLKRGDLQVIIHRVNWLRGTGPINP